MCTCIWEHFSKVASVYVAGIVNGDPALIGFEKFVEMIYGMAPHTSFNVKGLPSIL